MTADVTTTVARVLAYVADEMEAVIADGDVAEVAAPVAGEAGRSRAIKRRDDLYNDPHAWLLDNAAHVAAKVAEALAAPAPEECGDGHRDVQGCVRRWATREGDDGQCECQRPAPEGDDREALVDIVLGATRQGWTGSYTHHVADAVLASSWLADRDARMRAEGREQVGEAVRAVLDSSASDVLLTAGCSAHRMVSADLVAAALDATGGQA